MPISNIDLTGSPVELFGAFGFGVLCLILGLRWLNKDRDSLNAALDVERQERWSALSTEIEECKQDRAEMRQELGALQGEIRSLMKQMVAVATQGKCKGECVLHQTAEAQSSELK